ncbi:hypothetical protein D3C86_1659370 [compost metagenome]
MVQTAGGRNDHHFLATAQAFWASFGVAEGLTGYGDAVDPGLELGWNGEVVHRCGNHHGIGGEEFSQRLGAQIGFVLLRGIAQFCRGAGSHQGGGGEMADGVGSQVTVSHHGARLGGLPGLDDFAAQLTGSRVVAKNARIDMQQFHVGISK